MPVNGHSQKLSLQTGLHRVPRAARGVRELYVVDAPVLARIITPALDDMDLQHPRPPRGFKPPPTPHTNARLWLVASLHTSEKMLYRIEHNEVERVGLSLADAILTLLGLEHLVHDLPFYPNPFYSRQRWIERAKMAGVTYAKREYDELVARHGATLQPTSGSTNGTDARLPHHPMETAQQVGH